METTIKETYYRAFKDLVTQKIMEKEYEWVVRLYKEIKDRLLALVRFESELYKEMDRELDPGHLEQMLVHEVLDMTDLCRITDYLFGLCLSLGSPARDAHVKQERDRILADVRSDGITSLAVITPDLILSCNKTIDDIYVDLEGLTTNMKNTEENTNILS